MNLRTKIGVVAVLLSTLTVQAQNIPFRKAEIKEILLSAKTQKGINIPPEAL